MLVCCWCGAFFSCPISRCYSLYERFHFNDVWEPGDLFLGGESFSGTALLGGSGVTNYQTTKPKTITKTLLQHHLQGVNLGWRSTKIALLRSVVGLKIRLLCSFFDIVLEYLWFDVYENWRSVPQGLFRRRLRGVKNTQKCLKMQKHVFCTLKVPRNHLSIDFILSILKSISYRSCA